MNGNRSKYTYTPTYGMQKRGLMRRNTSVRQAPESPDFTQVPDPAIGVPLQQTASMPVQPPAAAVQPNSYLPNLQSFAAGQQPAMNPPPAQIPFAAPTFVQSGQYAPLPPMQTMSGYQHPPLGNSMGSFQSADHFGRTQGFVPPKQNPSIPSQPVMNPAPAFSWPPAPAAGQTVPPFSGSNANPGSQIPPYYQQSVQTAPVYPPLQPIPQQNGFTVQANEPHKAPRAASLNADKLWSVFLFGLLPLLFIPCLFVPESFDFLRYLFLASAVGGLGVMWYRQMYTPASRLITSIIYVALSIGIIAMLMQGANDAHQVLGNSGENQQQVQETPVPEALSAAAAGTPIPTPEPTVAGPSEAEKRLTLFMELWKVNNTTEMVNLVQPSWRGQQENASTSLFVALANRTPEDFKIEEISGTETDNSRTVTMRATINKNTGKAPVVYRFMVMMVKEGGEWYVNPNSLATNDAEETTTQDENVVKTQSSGAVTEPPRETVTPAPPASTLLYYNLGGNFYHMDPQCSSVGKDYLPFDASFSYADLKDYNRELLPCLSCNAPVDTLD